MQHSTRKFTTMNILCLLLAQYRVRYHAQIIVYSKDWNGSLDVSEARCHSAGSYFTSRNFTMLLDFVANRFAKQEKFIVVLPASDAAVLSNFQDELKARIDHLGLSRWLVESNDDILDEQGPQLMRIIPDFFLCYVHVVRRAEANVPADFIECHKRRKVFPTTISDVEVFKSPRLALVCNKMCSFSSNSDLVPRVLRYLNVTLSIVRLNHARNAADLYEQTFRLLNTRQAELSLYPVVVNGRIRERVSMSYPIHFLQYRLLTMKKQQHLLGSLGLLKVFDLRVWFYIGFYAVVEIIFMGWLMTDDPLGAYISVLASLVGQPYKLVLGFCRRINAASLYLAALILGSIFRNTLISCLNIQVSDNLETEADFVTAVAGGVVHRACVHDFEYFTSLIDVESNNALLKTLGRMKELQRLQLASDQRECVEFIFNEPNSAAVLTGPGTVGPLANLHTADERAHIYVSRSIVAYDMVGYSHAPWLSFAEEIQKAIFLFAETCTFNWYKHLVMGRKDLGKQQNVDGRAFSLADLDVAFKILRFGLILSLISSVINVLFFLLLEWRNRKKRKIKSSARALI